MRSLLIASVLLMTTALANAQNCKPGEGRRMSKAGKPQCANTKPTWTDCVQGGVSLGYGQSGAEAYCRKRGLHHPT